jgi:hypothetical protein
MMKAAGEKPWAYEKEESAKEESTQPKEESDKGSKKSQEKLGGGSTEAEI